MIVSGIIIGDIIWREKMKDKMVKYTSIIFILAFFTFITIDGLKNTGKPSGHTHLHTKPKPEEPKPEPYVLVADIIFEVYMGDS